MMISTPPIQRSRRPNNPMPDYPIIFSREMIAALRAGRKTQTRRLATSPLRKVKPGDRLWVREAWRAEDRYDNAAPKDIPTHARVSFDAESGKGLSWKGRPSIHMPRWVSRLTLVVTATKTERLQDISDADAFAEGIQQVVNEGQQDDGTARGAFKVLWESLHGPGSWDATPEVIAITFTVHHRNIDAMSPTPSSPTP